MPDQITLKLKLAFLILN